jgi:hypothetical protein
MIVHPSSGGRVILELDAETAEEIRYRAELYTPDELFRAPVTIGVKDGAVSYGAWDASQPPAWLVDFATAFLRGEWRARQKAPSAWPRRVSRWREPLPR